MAKPQVDARLFQEYTVSKRIIAGAGVHNILLDRCPDSIKKQHVDTLDDVARDENPLTDLNASAMPEI